MDTFTLRMKPLHSKLTIRSFSHTKNEQSFFSVAKITTFFSNTNTIEIPALLTHRAPLLIKPISISYCHQQEFLRDSKGPSKSMSPGENVMAHACNSSTWATEAVRSSF